MKFSTIQKKQSCWFLPPVQKFKETPFLLKGLTNKRTGYVDSLVKEATEKWLYMEKFHRNSGFTWSQAWYPVTDTLTNQKKRQSTVRIWLSPSALTDLQLATRQVYGQVYTGLSKKMDGIWNRYNLKSTGRIYTFGILKCSEEFKVLDLP